MTLPQSASPRRTKPVFTGDGTTVFYSGTDYVVRRWQVREGREGAPIPGIEPNDMSMLATDAQGKWLAFGNSSAIVLWDLAADKRGGPALAGHVQVKRGTHMHTSVHRLAFSPEGRFLATTAGSQIKVWDLTTGTERAALQGHANLIEGIAFLPSGEKLVTAGSDGTVKLWNPAVVDRAMTLKGPDSFMAAAFSPDGRLLATGGGRGLLLWNPQTGKQVRALEGHQMLVECLAFHPDGTHLVSGTSDFPHQNGRTNELFVWEVNTGRLVQRLEGNGPGISYVGYSRDGRKLASVSKGTIHIWQMATGQILHTWKHPRGAYWKAVAWHPDGRHLVAASDWANDIQLWDLVTGTQVQQLEPSEQYNVKPETMANVYSLAFSPDGKWLAAGGPNRVHIWETADFRRAYILRDISGGAYQVAFSPDNTRLATAGLDVRLWNFRRGQEVLRLEDHTSPVKSVSFSPNGQLLVTASTDATARLYDATPVPEPPPQTWREWWEQTWPGVVLGMGIVILLLIFILVFLVMRRLFRWIRRRFRKVTEPQPG